MLLACIGALQGDHIRKWVIPMLGIFMLHIYAQMAHCILCTRCHTKHRRQHEPMVKPYNFFVNNIFCNIKKRFLNLSGHDTLTYYHLEAVFLVSMKNSMDQIPLPHIAISTWVPTNLRPCFGHLGSDRPDLNFYRRYQLLQIELLNN